MKPVTCEGLAQIAKSPFMAKPRRLDPEHPLQIGARCNNREPFPVPMETAWDVFGDYLYAISKQFDIGIISFVLMNNHFHLIARDPAMQLSKAMELFMRETSKEISRLSGKVNRLWGRPFHSSVITSPLYFLHAYKYNYRNPVAAKVCNNVLDYKWSTLRILLGYERSIIPIQYDDTLFSSVEETLAWLNEDYRKDEVASINLAKKRRIFEMPRDSKTLRSNPLACWSSVPLFARRVSEK